MASAIRADTGLVYLCNPNNPIPSVIEKNALEEFMLEVSRTRMVFIDEAYHEYVNNPAYSSMMHLVRDGHRKIVVARTASKIHGLAGLCAGFGYAHPDTIKLFREKKTAGLKILGQHAALASYQDKEFQKFAREKNLEALAVTESYLEG